jgi:hypothetical protein
LENLSIYWLLITGSWTGTIETNGTTHVRVIVTLIQKEGKITSWLVSGADTKPVAIENQQGGYLLHSGSAWTTAIGSAKRSLRIQDLAAT